MKEFADGLQAHWEIESQHQRQRQLLLAVSQMRAADVEGLVAARADPNHRGERMQTCLHVAAKTRSVETVRALLRSGADLSIQDVEGNAPAHLFPLFANEDTIQLFNLLAPSESILALRNRAGVVCARRFAAWARTGQGLFKPYMPAIERVDQLRIDAPSLFAKRVVEGVEPCSNERITQVRRMTIQARHGAPVFSWSSAGGPAVNVVVITAGPWTLEEFVWDRFADELCSCIPCNMFLLNELSLSLRGPVDFDDALAVVVDMIHALPLTTGVVLVDNTGVFTSLPWRLQVEILGVAAINPACFYGDDFAPSATLSRMFGFFDKTVQRVNCGDADVVREVVEERMRATFFVHDGTAMKDLASLFERMVDAYGCSHYRNFLVLLMKGYKVQTEALRGHPALHGLPALLICGDNAPALVCHETVANLRDLRLPRAEIHYIGDSKASWMFEGSTQREEVIAALVGFIATDALMRSCA